MGSGRALASLPRINSETNLAVQLLLAVSDGRVGKRETIPPTTPPSGGSCSDARGETSDDSEATEAASPSLATTPVLKQKEVTSSPSPSPRVRDGTLFKYNREERREALERFREKKRRRQFHKRVRYMVRKRLAETRPRYKGRFSKPPPGENYDDGTPGPPAEKVKENVVAREERKSVEVKV